MYKLNFFDFYFIHVAFLDFAMKYLSDYCFITHTIFFLYFVFVYYIYGNKEQHCIVSNFEGGKNITFFKFDGNVDQFKCRRSKLARSRLSNDLTHNFPQHFQ